MSLIRREWLRSLFNRLAGLFRHSFLPPSSLGKRVPNLCLGKVGDVRSQKIRDVSSGSSLPGPSPLAAVPCHTAQKQDCSISFGLFQESGHGGHAFSSSPPPALISSLISESNLKL